MLCAPAASVGVEDTVVKASVTLVHVILTFVMLAAAIVPAARSQAVTPGPHVVCNDGIDHRERLFQPPVAGEAGRYGADRGAPEFVGVRREDAAQVRAVRHGRVGKGEVR